MDGRLAPAWRVAAITLATPTIVAAYFVGLSSAGATSTRLWHGPASEAVTTVVLLAGIGLVAALAWWRSLHGPAAVAGLALASSPWVVGGNDLGPGYTTAIFAGTALVVPVDAAVQDPRGAVGYLRTDSGALSLAAGLWYAGIALGLQGLSRSGPWLHRWLVETPLGPVPLVALLLGAGLLGGGATWALLEHGLYLPPTVAGLWMLWAIWSFLHGGPTGRGAFYPIRWTMTAPYPDTLFRWPWPTIGAIAAGCEEWVVRRWLSTANG